MSKKTSYGTPTTTNRVMTSGELNRQSHAELQYCVGYMHAPGI